MLHSRKDSGKQEISDEDTLRVQTSEIRENLSTLLSKVAFGGKHCIIQRNGKDLAALISMEDLAFFRKLEDWMDIQAAQAANNRPSIPWEKVKSKLGL